MTQPLVAQISQAAGLPSSVRVGRVESINPLVVSVQGGMYSSEAVGVVQPGVPAVGAPVVLLGQAGLSGGDPASWLLLGSVQQATGPATTASFVGAANVGTNSTTYVATGVQVGGFFVAPGSGRMIVSWRATMSATAGSAFLSPEVFLGDDDLGVGTAFEAASDARAIRTGQVAATAEGQGAQHLLSGLAPGAVYNIRLMSRSSAGGSTANFADRELIVMPAP